MRPTDPDLDLTLDRVIRAPRSRIWQAWTDPQQLGQWWLPAPARCRVERLEPVAGGAFVTSMSEDGATYVPHLDACFLLAEPQERIVFTNGLDSGWRPTRPEPVAMTAEIRLADHPDGTDYRVVVRHADPASRARHEGLGFADGWGTVTAQLAALCELDPRPPPRRNPMKLTLTQFVTIDGVYQDPGSPDEDPTDGFTRGGWMVPHMDQAFLAIASDWLSRASGLLLGRRTYEAFALAWPDMDPADPFAGRMNSLPKYVATRSGVETPWQPAAVLAGDAVARVAALKEQPGDELQLHGSARLSQSLLAAGLIDEVRLVITPTVLGQGRRLFAPGGPALGMRLADHLFTPGGLTVLVFESTGPATFDTYQGAATTPA